MFIVSVLYLQIQIIIVEPFLFMYVENFQSNTGQFEVFLYFYLLISILESREGYV